MPRIAHIPTLLLWGDKDTAVDPTSGQSRCAGNSTIAESKYLTAWATCLMRKFPRDSIQLCWNFCDGISVRGVAGKFPDMSNYFFDLLRGYLAHYGYWAVGAALLLENAGLPVPGETILLLASFLAYSEHKLGLPWIILVGVCAATLGDNLGFAIGYYGGRPPSGAISENPAHPARA